MDRASYLQLVVHEEDAPQSCLRAECAASPGAANGAGEPSAAGSQMRKVVPLRTPTRPRCGPCASLRWNGRLPVQAAAVLLCREIRVETFSSRGLNPASVIVKEI